jgi:hypothetical protein
MKKVTGFYPRSKVTPTSTRRRCSIPSTPHVYGAAPRSPSRRASATPGSSPPADAPRSARRESIRYWAAAGMVVSMIPVACEHRHRHCPSSARM